MITVWTIGHSTLAIEEFLGLLLPHGIEAAADVRAHPGSRRHPHFSSELLAQSLRAAGVEYLHVPALGGRRKARPDSRNNAWRNESFRGYADYMETEGFRDGIAILMRLASQKRTVIMCAETLWWRCHRALIADYLKASGVEVLHITAAGTVTPHPFTSAASLIAGQLTYNGEGGRGIERA